MVERIRHHRLHEREIVDDLRRVRNELGQFGAALPVFRELELRSEQLRVRVDERGAVALQQVGGRQRAVELRKLRLVIEHLEMARRSGHEQEDHRLRLRLVMRLLRGQRVLRGGGTRELAQRHGAESDAALIDKPASRTTHRLIPS
jgi:hypothetical protein